ncbi:MAG: hypothetical protein HN790_02350 [Methylococcales bacterium]|jgi:hypothetical protein|nr:hypothetical protein [Methylococcales bacterium]
MSNALMIIHPYKYEGVWVFDDDKVGLDREPFVSGIDVMIDQMVNEISDADNGFNMIFSSTPFPGFQVELKWVRKEFDGNWYFCEQLGFEGWLCPALFKYFDTAREKIFVQVKAKRG